MFPGAGVGGDAAGGDGAAAQGPKELLVPVLTLVVGFLHLGQGAGHPLVGVVDGLVQLRSVLGLQAVLLVPDIHGCGLERNLAHASRDGLQVRGFHTGGSPLV